MRLRPRCGDADPLAGRLGLGHVPAGQDDRGATRGEHLGGLEPDPRVGAGDQGDLPVLIRYVGRTPLRSPVHANLRPLGAIIGTPVPLAELYGMTVPVAYLECADEG